MNEKNPDNFGSLKEYVKTRIRGTSFSGAVIKVYKYIRRSLFVSRIIRFISYAIFIIQTSAVLIAAFSVFVILIPVILIALVQAYIFANYKNKKFVSSIINSGKKSVNIIFDDRNTDYEKNEIPGGEDTIIVNVDLTALIIPPRKINKKNYRVNSGCYYIIKKCDLEIQIITNDQRCDKLDNKT